MKCLIGFLTAAAIAFGAAANMSGTWVLNSERSRFGDNPRPSGVVLTIEHDEPALKYSGAVNNPSEGHINDFQFQGAIDGKPYTVQQDRGERQVTLRRISDRAVESRSEWSDGELRSTITISGDGRTLERVMVFKDREGKTRRWVEIYEKKQ